jgi:hypothetical protein
MKDVKINYYEIQKMKIRGDQREVAIKMLEKPKDKECQMWCNTYNE